MRAGPFCHTAGRRQKYPIKILNSMDYEQWITNIPGIIHFPIFICCSFGYGYSMALNASFFWILIINSLRRLSTRWRRPYRPHENEKNPGFFFVFAPPIRNGLTPSAVRPHELHLCDACNFVLFCLFCYFQPCQLIKKRLRHMGVIVYPGFVVYSGK